jgi:hypothetical protein
MARSLKVSPEYIKKVNSAVTSKGYPSKTKFAEHVTPSLSTVKNFLSGEPVDFEYFVEICEKLELNWQEIAYREPETQPAQNNSTRTVEDYSPFSAGTPIPHPRYFFRPAP